jgi:ankyrin repeat protein
MIMQNASTMLSLHPHLAGRQWKRALAQLRCEPHESNITQHESDSFYQQEEQQQLDQSRATRLAQTRGCYGDLPLHVLCDTPCNVASSGDTSLVVEQSDDYESFLELVQKLIEIYPDAVLEPNNDGDLPLNLACRQGLAVMDHEVVDILLAAIPHSLGGLDCIGRVRSCRLPLHEAVASPHQPKQQRNTIQASIPTHTLERIVARYPQAASRLDGEGNLPLHYVCANTALNKQLVSCVDVIVDAFMDALKVKDANGNVPLHLACQHGASPLVIRFLVEQYPSAIQMRNSAGDLPLHLACQCQHLLPERDHLELVQTLVELHPQGVRERGNFGGLPLHEACSHGSVSLELVQFLIQMFPQGVQFSTHNRKKMSQSSVPGTDTNEISSSGCEGVNLPLHFACDSNASKEVIHALLDAYPPGVCCTDPDGLLPLHLAVTSDHDEGEITSADSGASFSSRNRRADVVRELLHAYPESASQPAPHNGSLPLHEACLHSFCNEEEAAATRSSEDRDCSSSEGTTAFAADQILRLLIDAYPEALRRRNLSGKRPKDVARACLAPPRIVQLLTTSNQKPLDTKW